MRKLKVGDKVKVYDASYVFGVIDGRYSTNCHYRRVGYLTVLRTGLNAKKNADYDSNYDNICDILVTDGITGFWFAKSNQVELVTPVYHTISIDDGKKVKLSDESYKNIKRNLD